MTLWSITRAPLMFGGRLPLDKNDTWTLPLLSASRAQRAHTHVAGSCGRIRAGR